jgi:hypothetical protein
MAMSEVTQEKINALVEELRSWESDRDDPPSLLELSQRFDLQVFVVDRVARSEGLKLPPLLGPSGQVYEIDPDASTINLDPEKVEAATRVPDPDPSWRDRDRDSGIWTRKPSGEWERHEPDEGDD